MSEDLNIKKGFKSYLLGKKLSNTNSKKSFLYFKQSLKYLKKCKNDKYKDIVQETQTECDKFLQNSIVTNFIENNTVEEKKVKIFSLIAKGKLNELKKYNFGEINMNEYNNDGLTPLHYCLKMGDTNMLKILFKLGGKIDTIDKKGHTLLEYACLEKDPNAISFLINHGANMKKNLFFRDGNKKYNLTKDDIDLANIIKIILTYYNKNSKLDNLNFVYNFIDKEKSIGLDELKLEYLINSIDNLLETKGDTIRKTYTEIIREELSYPLKKKLGCPSDKIDILLINIVHFIDYPFNVSSDFLLSNEIKYLIFNILKKKYSKINESLRYILLEEIWEKYIKTKLYLSDHIGILTNQWMKQIKYK